MSEFRLVLDSVWSKPDLFKVLVRDDVEVADSGEDEVEDTTMAEEEED